MFLKYYFVEVHHRMTEVSSQTLLFLVNVKQHLCNNVLLNFSKKVVMYQIRISLYKIWNMNKMVVQKNVFTWYYDRNEINTLLLVTFLWFELFLFTIFSCLHSFRNHNTCICYTLILQTKIEQLYEIGTNTLTLRMTDNNFCYVHLSQKNLDHSSC